MRQAEIRFRRVSGHGHAVAAPRQGDSDKAKIHDACVVLYAVLTLIDCTVVLTIYAVPYSAILLEMYLYCPYRLPRCTIIIVHCPTLLSPGPTHPRPFQRIAARQPFTRRPPLKRLTLDQSHGWAILSTASGWTTIAAILPWARCHPIWQWSGHTPGVSVMMPSAQASLSSSQCFRLRSDRATQLTCPRKDSQRTAQLPPCICRTSRRTGLSKLSETPAKPSEVRVPSPLATRKKLRPWRWYGCTIPASRLLTMMSPPPIPSNATLAMRLELMLCPRSTWARRGSLIWFWYDTLLKPYANQPESSHPVLSDN
jgi:hypothetical protein